MLVNSADEHHQIVPLAFFMVKCGCGYAHDAFSETEDDAILEVRARHACPFPMIVVRYDCRQHQTIGRCRECAR